MPNGFRTGRFFVLRLKHLQKYTIFAMQTEKDFSPKKSMNKINRLIIVGFFVLSLHGFARAGIKATELDTTILPKKTHLYRANPLDSIYKRKANGTIWLPGYLPSSAPVLTFRDTMFVNPLFLPVVFMGNTLPPSLFPASKEVYNPYRGLLLSEDISFSSQLKKSEFIGNARRSFYREYPNDVKWSRYNTFRNVAKVDDGDVLGTFNPFKDPIVAESGVLMRTPDVEGAVIQRKYWIYTGEHSLQFSQNYFSSNWHKGGTSNLNINNSHVIKANYKKNKVRFNNTLEWRLSLFSAPEDTIRSIRIGEDFVRYYGDLGVDAFVRKWSYSTNLEVKTQLFNNYAVNSNELRSAFLSPLYANAGIGMKYQLDEKSTKVRSRRLQLTVALAPFSGNLRYVYHPNVPATRYGIPEGKSMLFNFGTTVTSMLTYDISRDVSWNSRFKYFTNYKNMEAEFENTLNLALTRFLSTRIYVNLRYDDSVKPDDKFKYLQVNEVLSFGLNYKW